MRLNCLIEGPGQGLEKNRQVMVKNVGGHQVHVSIAIEVSGGNGVGFRSRAQIQRLNCLVEGLRARLEEQR